jgi:hypothetical protein
LVLAPLLLACSSAAQPSAAPTSGATLAAELPAATPTASEVSSAVPALNLARLPGLTDEQGAVIVEVAPRDLAEGASQIEFEVSLNTHAVDLSFDLAQLSTLTTDTGLVVPASMWDAPLGGHHVSGTLMFPSTLDGTAVLENARTLTLTIVDVDAAVRTFEWQLP